MAETEKVMVFIDGSNLYHQLIENFGAANLDYSKFVDFLVGKRVLIKSFFYTAPIHQQANPHEYSKQQKFFSSLRQQKRFEVKLGRLEKRPQGKMVEKGVDVMLVVDLITNAYANRLDTAILVSGDADFVPAIKAVQELEKKVENVSFPIGKSFHLNQQCDQTISFGQTEFTQLRWNQKK